MNRYKNYLIKIILISAVFIFIISILTCGKKVLNVSLIGGKRLNGENAVVVRIYQLKSADKFQLATKESFWKGKDSDIELLKNELIPNSRQELILRPNEERRFPIEIEPDTKFIGVAADFNKPDKDRWRYFIPITKFKGKAVVVVLGEDSLIITDINSVNLSKK